MSAILPELCLAALIKLIYELTGISVAADRSSLVESRLRKRLRSLNLSTYESYLKLVKEDKLEQCHFIDLVTTNETYFYRTPRIWEHIENNLLVNWLSARPKMTFTAWSAASSSGEEAHTLGIICQSFKEKNPQFNYKIIGTDISSEMVSRCQKGQYSGRSVEVFKRIRPDLFKKYLIPESEGSFQVNQKVKSHIRFFQHNLFNPLDEAIQFDLVLLRNVLIYFKGPDQEKVISLMSPKMAKDAVLIIGESESLTYINTPFKSVEPLIYKNASAVRGIVAG
jgi:chemotaxis protein methyltransferase CheR